MTDLDLLGGKGANLVRLRDAGFPVPAFVVLGTDEYRAFVAAHGLDAVIADALALPAAAASERIRAAFRRPLPADQRARLTDAVAPLLDRPVAVRSSATAEDLPEASFAGQQDTFLDVLGLDAVLDAVVECWSSLWTERALTYRARNAVDHGTVALAVVVQEMVAAEASGVMFTADPLTGHRGRTVVDAVFGLGEQLVSGQVTPDHFEVETATGRLLERRLGGERSPLSDAHLTALADLGRRVADRFGGPQDLEWTRVGDALHLVQTRPITSLYPLPEGFPDDALWLSFGAFQGMLEPLHPLGQDAVRMLAAGGASLFGARLDYRTLPFLGVAGERLWVRADLMLRNGLGHRVIPAIMNGVDPNAATLIRRFVQEDAYAVVPGSSRGTARGLARTLGPLLPRFRGTLFAPDETRRTLDRDVEEVLATLGARLDAAARVARPDLRLAARLRALEDGAPHAFRTLLPDFFPIIGPSVAMTQRLRTLAARTGLPDADALALTTMRALPGNVTTEMDLALWAVAQAIRADAPAAALAGTDPAELAASYLDGTLPLVAQDAVAGFLARYGMRGVSEIDLGAPRWRDQPEAVFRTLASYVAIDPEDGPDVAYDRGAHAAADAVDRLAAASTPGRARQIRFLASRIRALFGARETPKFTLIRLFGLLRTGLDASGRDLVEAGVLDAPDDLYFLHADELRGAFGRRDLRPLVAERRGLRERERRRTRVPVLLVGDGRTFFDAGTGDSDADLAGLGVSPGVVEGVARVVHDPATSALRPGEILVCRGTDPAWTPLFLTASGLVTEVGGLMTHGSVVAREYGLPAVVGVPEATLLLADSPRIRLDGSAGTLTFLDRPSSQVGSA